MERKEIIWLSATTLVFVLTSLLLKDLFLVTNVFLFGLIGGISGLLAFWWGFKFIRNRTEKQQIIFTGIYCCVLLVVAYFVSEMQTNTIEITSYKLEGKWISPSMEGDDPDLIFRFQNRDSLFVFINEQEFQYEFAVENRHLLLTQNDEVKFDWLISELNEERLIIGDGKQILTFTKME